MDLSDYTLCAWLAGVLEPADAQRLSRRIRQDPTLAARVAALRNSLPVPQTRSPLWHIPRPGRGVRPGGRPGIERGWAPAAVLGSEPLQPGDVVLLRFVPQEPDWRLVVLRQVAGRWEVVEPRHPEDPAIGPKDLRSENGVWELPLELAGPPGRQRLAVVCMPPAWQPRWELDAEARWEPLRREVASGACAVASFEVDLG